MHIMSREDALKSVITCVDTALSARYVKKLPENARLCVWEGSSVNPLVVAVIAYTMDTSGNLDYVPDSEAQEIATDFLVEKSLIQDGCLPDYIL